jgi:hypothetical protein
MLLASKHKLKIRRNECLDTGMRFEIKQTSKYFAISIQWSGSRERFSLMLQLHPLKNSDAFGFLQDTTIRFLHNSMQSSFLGSP